MMKTRTGARRWSILALSVTATLITVYYATYPTVINITRAAARHDLKELLLSGMGLGIPLVALTFSATGLVIHRHGSNLIGWLMHGIGLGFANAAIGNTLFVLNQIRWELDVVARATAWITFGWIPAAMLMTVFLPLLFPTGRPPSRRWWWVAGIGAAGLVYAFFAVSLGAVTRPPDQILPEEGATWVVVAVLMVTGALAAITSTVVRYRRADGVERLQLKWVSAALVFASSTVPWSIAPVTGDLLEADPAQLLYIAAWCTIPVSVGIAISRYHLYDIDRIVSRTVGYALVALIVGAVYAGVVVVFGSILGSRSDLTVAASTLAAAAAVSPVRRHIQRIVDRRFNRPRYHAQQELVAYAQRLRDQVDLAAVSDDLLGVVDRTLQPSSLMLWIRKRRHDDSDWHSRLR